MIDRAAVVGTFPDPAVCRALFLACAAVAALMLSAALYSWLKGD